MKKLMLWLIAFAALAGSALAAQDVTGTWQGTLAAGRSMRLVLVIARDEHALKGKLYSIDQGPDGMSTTSLTVDGGMLRFALAPLDITFEGKLGADGKTAAGTWKQGSGNPIPFTLEHVTPEAAWQIPKSTEQTKPMPADADPTFEVATIKPSQPDRPGKLFTFRGRRFITINTTLEDLISYSYGMQAKQILNEPSWASTDKFDIEGQPDLPGRPTPEQSRSMIRKLLAERFKLTIHRDKKELSVYALEPARSGPKLTKSEGAPNGPRNLFFRDLGRLTVHNAAMTDFSQMMQSAVLDRPVIDRTGLTGRYDFTLNWTPDESQFGGMGMKVPPPSDAADAPPALYTAIQEQLGLRLEATKAPADVIVIDKVEKPTEN